MNIELTYIENNTWVVDEEYTRNGVSVPKGFVTDLASTPRMLWSIYPPFGKYLAGAIVHDYLYYIKSPRREADISLRYILKQDGVGLITRWSFYVAVRAFGWISYNNY